MMNNELRPYDKYKKTGIFWLDYIPNGWDWRYLSQIAGERCLKNSAGLEDNVLSLSYGNIIRKKNIDFGLVPKEYSNYQIVEDGNIILRLTDLQNDKRSLRTGLVNERGIITSAYTCLDVKCDSPKFVHYLLHAFDLMKVFYGLGGGVRQSIGFQDIRKLRIPIPPREEQDQIVKYLDYKLAKINKFIKAKKKLIAVLKEQKQAIINQAVTKGLDPDVKMKSSGIEWLGALPENWKLIKLKYIAEKFASGVTPKGGASVYKETGIPFLRSQNVHNEGLRLDKVSFISEEVHEKMSSSRVQPDDVLLNITGASIGRVCKVPSDFKEGNVNQHICIIRLKRDVVNPQYIAYYISSNVVQKQIIMLQNGASREGLPLKITKNFIIPLPDISVQNDIVQAIMERTHDIQNGILKIEKELDFLLEYKNSLISGVVTGKVDVRYIFIEEIDQENIDEVDFDVEDENETEEELIDEGGDE